MTKRIALFALVSIAAFGQVTVTLKPIRTVTVRKALNLGRAAGVWTVTACNDAATKLTLDRGRIETAAVELSMLPNDLAEDVLGRQARDSVHSIIGENGDAILGLGGDAIGIAGFAIGSRETQLAALAITGARLVFRAQASRAPNPTPYISRLLPDALALPANGCASQVYVLASLLHDAKPIQRQILIRGQ